jgi:hypothetical protein
LSFVSSRPKRASRKSPPVSPSRQFMQIAVPFFLPIPWLGSLESILRLDHPLMAYTLSPLLVAVALAVGYAFRVTARAVAAASRRRVPRPIYGLAGLS